MNPDLSLVPGFGTGQGGKGKGAGKGKGGKGSSMSPAPFARSSARLAALGTGNGGVSQGGLAGLADSAIVEHEANDDERDNGRDCRDQSNGEIADVEDEGADRERDRNPSPPAPPVDPLAAFATNVLALVGD
uniref:Uncharacterized protein n=1 Tax=Chromera velia CCMP2878 TaxID=1169474 RepID=A0A0G4HDV1_9ALVE|eukprot:Cvel_26509.t1-p1 / transcript=Cvel_26509.t1 / gene=Cvel_26509 / organism=Chromera_velia_CCMP2878 / gene_product=hypothetical protein / transcript_product=hypothetical protein / location=Cvel_scaffold3163:15216-15608(-) / protein_length=131 / sequence_SO=supercontig / SO=protein_coding / is_pseudo=false